MPHSLTAKPFEALRNISLGHAVCGGVVCTAPALLAAYLHNPLFSWSATAAFWSYLSLPTDTYSRRWVFGLAGTLASGLGAWTVAWPALAIGLAAVFGFAGAYAQTCGARIDFPALLMATAFAVSTAFPGKDLAHGVTYAGYFLYGSLWATSFALLFQRLAQNAPPVAAKGPVLWTALKNNSPRSPSPFCMGCVWRCRAHSRCGWCSCGRESRVLDDPDCIPDHTAPHRQDLEDVSETGRRHPAGGPSPLPSATRSMIRSYWRR